MLDGGAGHTYGANGIWQANQPGKPYGPSPHGFSWGNVPWSDAMRYPASTQLGLGKAMLDELPWTRLVPASETVRFVMPELPPMEQSRWVWPREDNGRDLLMGTTFELPADAKVRRAVLRLACDERYGLTINRQAAHRYYKLDYPQRDKHTEAWLFPLAGSFLRPGRNVLLLRFSKHARITQRSELLGHLHVELADGRTLNLPLNDWRWHRPKIGWPGDVMKLDPDGWQRAEELADGRADPSSLAWRELEPYGPRCATMPRELWVVYTPDGIDVELSSLPPSVPLRVTRFDPRTGKRVTVDDQRSDAFGRLILRVPAAGGDQVFIVGADSE